MATIASLVVNVVANTANFSSGLMRANKELRAFRARTKNLVAAGASVTREMRAPMEVYRDNVTKLNNLLTAGQINHKTYGRAIGQARSELVDTIGIHHKARLALLAVTGTIYGAMRTWGKYETEIAALRGIVRPTIQQLDAIKASIERIGKANYLGPSETAAVFTELLKAGQPVQTVMNGAAEAAIQFSRVGGIEVRTAAITISDALNAFSREGLTAAEAVNILASAADASSVDINHMTAAFAMSSAVYSSFGQTMRDLSAAIGILGNAGLKGSDAGTSLKTMLLRLATGAEGTDVALKELGISVRDATGQMLPLRTIIGLIEQKLAGLSEAARADYLYRIFRTDAIRAASILLRKGVQGWDEFTKQMDQSMTVTEKHRLRMQTWEGSMMRFRAAVETAGQQLGEALVPAMNELVAILSSGAARLATVIKNHKDFVIQFAKASVVVLGVVSVLPRLVAGYSAVQNMVRWLSVSYKQLTADIIANSAAARANVTALGRVGGRALGAAALAGSVAYAFGGGTAEVIGSSMGAAFGATVGSIMPGVGNVLGTVAGSLIGNAIGRAMDSMANQEAFDAAWGKRAFLAETLSKSVMDANNRIIELRNQFKRIGPEGQQAISQAAESLNQYRRTAESAIARVQMLANSGAGTAAERMEALSQAQAAIKDLQDAARNVSVETRRSVSAIAQADEIDQATMAVVQYNERLREQIAVFDMATEEAQRYHLQLQGASAESLQITDALIVHLKQLRLGADIDTFSKSLKEQIATLGKTTEEIELYRLAQQGAADWQLRHAAALVETLRIVRERETINKSFKDLDEEVRKLQMSEKAARMYGYAMQGMTAGDLQAASAKLDMIDALKRQQSLMEKGKQLTEQMMTPMEAFAKKIAEYRELLAAGAISFETFSRAVKSAYEEIAPITELQSPEAKVVRALSMAGRPGARQSGQGKTLEQMLNVADRQLSAMEETRKYTRELADTLGNPIDF